MNVEIVNKSSIVKMNMKDILVENIVSIMDEEHNGTNNSLGDGSMATIPRRLFIFLSYHIPNSILKEEGEFSSVSVTVPAGDTTTSTSVSVVKWEVECMFCILNDLNKIIENSSHHSHHNSKSSHSSIVKLATNIIPTIQNTGNTVTSNSGLHILAEFPKNFERLKNQSLLGSLGMSSMSINMSSMMGGAHHNRNPTDASQEEDKKKRKTLVVWLQDVMHNFDFLPVEAKTLLIELVHKSKLVSKDEPIMPESSPKQSHQLPSSKQNVAPTRSISPQPSHRERASIVSPMRSISEQLSLSSQSNDRNDRKSVSKTKARPLVEMVTVTVPVAKSGDLDASRALCISRNERILSRKQLNTQSLTGKVLLVKLAVIGFILITGTSSLCLEWLSSLSVPVKVFVISAGYLLYLFYEEEDDKAVVEDSKRRDTYGYVESLIRDFFQRDGSAKEEGFDLDLQAIIFNTEAQQPYIPTPPVVQCAKSGIINPLLKKPSMFLSNAVSAVSFTFNRQKSHALPADSIAIPQAVPISEEEDEALDGGVNANDEPDPNREESMFEEFHFTDLTPAARDIYIDRRYTHNFQVRGQNYKSDGKKIHPGSAICKCMLMEIYEVEAKVRFDDNGLHGNGSPHVLTLWVRNIFMSALGWRQT